MKSVIDAIKLQKIYKELTEYKMKNFDGTLKDFKALSEILKCTNLAISALEKQKPTKPLPEQRYYGIGQCPKCEAVFTDDTTKYCGSCGQALNWESEN